MNFDISVIAEVGNILTMICLLLFSILSVTIIIERAFFYHYNSKAKINETLKNISEHIQKMDLISALNYCEQQFHSASNIVKSGLEYLKNRPLEKVDTQILHNTMINTIEDEKTKLEKFLGVIGSIGSSAPLVGLFGTVLGIVQAFQQIQIDHSSEFYVVAGGIKNALYTTALGILVAVPAIMFYNYFVRRAKGTLEQLDNLASKFVLMIEEKKVEENKVER